jgi:uncharacterized Zn-binding protein involved in type VI secretion
MPAMARLGDIGIGICPCHNPPQVYVTTFITGAPTVNNDGPNTCIITTLGASSCGHVTTALTGSPTVKACGQPVHRIGDMGMNCGPYNVVTGSSKQFADDHS